MELSLVSKCVLLNDFYMNSPGARTSPIPPRRRILTDSATSTGCHRIFNFAKIEISAYTTLLSNNHHNPIRYTLMKKYLVEGIGTFFLVLTIGLTAVYGSTTLAPVAIGAILMI